MEARRVVSPNRRSRSAVAHGSPRCPHNGRTRRAIRAAGLLAALVWTTALQAATVTSRNFVVHAPTEDIARQVAQTAEQSRRDLAIAWLGEELRPWYRRCPSKANVGRIGAGGATTFAFEGGEVFGWNMNVQGTLERILDSVIPHEVSHTIFASYFRRPLPRWADEGAATLVEHESERLRQTKILNQVLRTNRRIPLQQLLQITEYPEDMQQVLTLYAEGYSLADFLVQLKGEQGRKTYLEFLNDAHQHNWEYAFRKHYDFEAVRDVEKVWTDWIIAGSPELPTSDGTLLASTQPQSPSAQSAAAESAETDARLASATAAQSSARTALQPLPPIQRRLRRRLAGRHLEAPEPSVTAMPARDVDVTLGEAAGAPSPVAATQTIPIDADSADDRGQLAMPARTGNPRGRQRVPRPEPIVAPSPSLRSVNAGSSDAFQN